MPRSESTKWTFAPRFRRNAFGWRSQPAIARVKEAVTEIKKCARSDPTRAADGAVLFLEKVSPALAHVDGSSGAIGTAVNHAIRDLVQIIAGAPADESTRDAWLERLWAALAADEIPYIERLADHWGELCTSNVVAAAWADRLAGITRMDPRGMIARLSALYSAGRHADIVDILADESFWPYKRWAVRALIAMGKRAEAIRTAEGCRGSGSNDRAIDALCEQVLLDAGMQDEAYRRYGLGASRAGTYLAWFRAVAKKYADRPRSEILADLVASTPGDDGKWFAAAKSAGLYDDAIRLALSAPCDPRTLTRAARDFAKKNPPFAVEAGLAALHWLVQGHGYEITADDVRSAYAHTVAAARANGTLDSTTERVRRLVESESSRRRFVTSVLGNELGLPCPPERRA